MYYEVKHQVLAWFFGIIAMVLTVAIVFGKDIKPTVTGDSGILEGVTVLDSQGNRVCDEPYWHKDLKIVSCE